MYISLTPALDEGILMLCQAGKVTTLASGYISKLLAILKLWPVITDNGYLALLGRNSRETPEISHICRRCQPNNLRV
jgi:hypothetical protein